MLRHSEPPLLPELSELPDVEDDPALFDPSPEWFVPGLKPSLRDDDHDDDGHLLRSLLDRPEALSKAWRAAMREGFRNRTRGAKLRRCRRVPRWSDAA